MLPHRLSRAEARVVGHLLDGQVTGLQQVTGPFDALLGEPLARADAGLVTEAAREGPYRHGLLRGQVAKPDRLVQAPQRPRTRRGRGRGLRIRHRPLAVPVPGAARRAVTVLASAVRTGPFWLLAGTFAICGASTNGLIQTHFVPAAHDHGMPITAAASLLAVIGVFDVLGTIASGWFTDRFEARRLLAVYYAFRGISLLFLPMLLAPSVHLPMVFFIVFYGLDWVATVPPTLALCREQYGEDSAIVFGWVLASHQVGAALVAFLGGVARDTFGSYDVVWYASGALCAVAALMSLAIRRRPVGRATMAF
jgi:hypothetical protein